VIERLDDHEAALFTNGQFHNTGIGYFATMRPVDTEFDVLLAPGRSERAECRQSESLSKETKVPDHRVIPQRLAAFPLATSTVYRIAFLLIFVDIASCKLISSLSASLKA